MMRKAVQTSWIVITAVSLVAALVFTAQGLPTPSVFAAPGAKLARPVAGGQVEEYAVQEGDTLASIAEQFGVTPEDLTALNEIEDAENLPVGQILLIPVTDEGPSSAEVIAESESSDTVSSTVVPVAVGAGIEEYEVEQGDSLLSIAQRYHTDVGTLQALNDLTQTILFKGQTLVVPAKSEPMMMNEPTASMDASMAASGTTYEVEAGDSLVNIARKYNVSAEEIASANKLDSTILGEGQTLVIPDSGHSEGMMEAAPADAGMSDEAAAPGEGQEEKGGDVPVEGAEAEGAESESAESSKEMGSEDAAAEPVEAESEATESEGADGEGTQSEEADAEGTMEEGTETEEEPAVGAEGEEETSISGSEPITATEELSETVPMTSAMSTDVPAISAGTSSINAEDDETLRMAVADVWATPDGSVQVFSPVEGGAYHSEIAVTGLSKTYGGNVNIHIADEGGDVLARRSSVGGDLEGFDFFETYLRFTVQEPTEAMLKVREVNVVDGTMMEEVVVPVMLLPGQRFVQVDAPVAGDVVCETLVVAGLSSTFEANVVLEVRSPDGATLEQTNTMGGSMGVYQDFMAELTPGFDAPNALLFAAYEVDASGMYDSVDETVVPVTFFPVDSSVCS